MIIIALIFAALFIFCYGLGLSWIAKEQRQHDIAHMTTMFGMFALIALCCIVTIGGYK